VTAVTEARRCRQNSDDKGDLMIRSMDRGRRRMRRVAAGLVGLAIVAAACSDKKDETSVGEETEATEAATATAAEEPTATTAAEETTETTSAATEPEETSGGTEASAPGEETATTAAEEGPAIPVQSTLPPPEGDPVVGGKLVVAGEAEVGAPWTPAAVQCDSYCQMRIRTFIEPMFVTTPDLQVKGWLAESIEANDDSTEFTITLRPGITFTDGSALTSAVAVDNLSRIGAGLLAAGALRDLAKNPDGTVMNEIVDDLTFKLFTGKNGDVNTPVKWYLFPYFLTTQLGFVASSEWLAAVDGDPTLATQPVGTGPFIVQNYLPGDRMTVTKNPDYWRTDEDGNQLPYLDEIEFRVIQDSQVRSQALESGDVDLIATSDPSVVRNYVDSTDFTMLQQNVRTETNYILFHVNRPPLDSQEVRCALTQAVDKQALIDAVYAGFSEPANAPFSPGQEGYLEDNGAPEYDPEAAAAAIEAWEAENGPLQIPYSTIPAGTARAVADFLQQAWGAVGVDVTQQTVEQSQLILAALLGDQSFYAFGWRNHAGLFVDGQNSWWHGFGADAKGSEVADGAPNLNFGRLNDPVINDLLDQARETEDADERRALAEDINREFAEQCWILPTSYTTWGIIMDPAVQNIGRDPLPDHDGFAADGAGFPGQVWLGSVFKSE
jgi:peptide/nickel transport system substrate-binding protein